MTRKFVQSGQQVPGQRVLASRQTDGIGPKTSTARPTHPWVGTIDNEALKQDACDLLTCGLALAVHKQCQQHVREEMGVGVGVAQLIGDGIQHQIAGLAVDLIGLYGGQRAKVVLGFSASYHNI